MVELVWLAEGLVWSGQNRAVCIVLFWFVLFWFGHVSPALKRVGFGCVGGGKAC